MTVREILAEALKAKGYDGCFCDIDEDGCGCGVDELALCDAMNLDMCQPARLGADGMYHPDDDVEAPDGWPEVMTMAGNDELMKGK